MHRFRLRINFAVLRPNNGVFGMVTAKPQRDSSSKSSKTEAPKGKNASSGNSEMCLIKQHQEPKNSVIQKTLNMMTGHGRWRMVAG